MFTKNYKKLLRVDKVIATNIVCRFFWPTLYSDWSCGWGLQTILEKSRP